MRPLDYLFSGDIKSFLLSLLFILPALVIGISFHEAAHAWMANRMGDPTARNLGRVTLDPTKHFDLFGIITFLLIGFGWGKSVPTNPRNYTNYKKGNVLVALAGVSMNMIIALITLIVISILSLTGVFSGMLPSYTVLTLTGIVHIILYQIASINLILCFFNLIPVPPLDGHHLVKGYIARKSPAFFMNYMRYGFIALIILMFAVPWFSTGLSFLVRSVIYGVGSLFGVI